MQHRLLHPSPPGGCSVGLVAVAGLVAAGLAWLVAELLWTAFALTPADPERLSGTVPIQVIKPLQKVSSENGIAGTNGVTEYAI